MGHLPVIANTFRVTVNWNTVAGVTPHNVFHIRTASVDESAIAGALNAAMKDGQWTILHNDLSAVDMDILALDGTSATTTWPVTNVHMQGEGSGDPLPSLAACIAFQTGARGPAKRGRIYLGPIGEGSIDGGNFTFDPSGIVGAWNDFNAALIAGTPSAFHVVASYVHHVATDVETYRFDLPVATMRRRLLQTRH